jgi:lipopolysaccharide transport system permease protein
LQSRQALGIGLVLGWQDIKQSYRRSVLGQLWITLGMAVTIGAIGVVFGTIFGTPLVVFLPYLASGFIMWALFTGIINDGTKAFISADRMINQLPLPKIAHLIRVVWKNVLLTGHNIVIFPIVILIVGGSLNEAVFLWPIGLLLSVVSLTGLALFLSVIAARFRDLPPIVSAVMTVAFYITPVIWMRESVSNSELVQLLLTVNPFFHLLQISRMPLIGEFPTLQNWTLAALTAAIFWLLGFITFKKYEHRIAYWV